MKKTITETEFIEEFKSIRPNNFSIAGLSALFEYLEQYEQESGKEIELDVIAICCDFSEYPSLQDFQIDYGDNYETIEDVEDATLLLRVDEDSFIIQNF